MIVKQRIYLNAARTKALPQGHPHAATLFAGAGQDVADKLIDKIEGAGILASRKFEENPAEEIPDGLDSLNASELRALADRERIDLGTLKKRQDVLDMIREEREARSEKPKNPEGENK